MNEFNDIGFGNSNKIGKAGEKWYIEYVKSKGLDVLDVSNDRYFQDIDVDVIVSNEKGTHFEENAARDIEDKLRSKNPIDSTLIDVKADTVAATSGNIYLEWVAHYKSGCFAITKADKWIYLYWDKEKKAPSKMWSIDINNLRTAVVRGQIKLGTFEYQSSDGTTRSGRIKEYRAQKDKNGNDPGMYAWVVPMEYLNSLKLAKEIKF